MRHPQAQDARVVAAGTSPAAMATGSTAVAGHRRDRPYEKLPGGPSAACRTRSRQLRRGSPKPATHAATMTDAPPTPETRCSARSRPLLHDLERDLRGWLDGAHRQPLRCIARADLEGLADDLRRQAEALDVDRPLLVVMLMGGTGVGKSTLLNALAGGPIAQASFTRPTTRDPVVYYHESVKPDRLDPALRHCRLAPHDRPALEQKIIVDTPDLDSNDLANRDKLQALLPVADIVLYVGSQEKYHDKLGWELFKEQRQRRAFAFVLNKWDRCLHAGSQRPAARRGPAPRPEGRGLREPAALPHDGPDVARPAKPRNGRKPPPTCPRASSSASLRNWLELGLTRLEIEAVKARGVGQLLRPTRRTGSTTSGPPDLTAEADRTRGRVGEDARARRRARSADVLVSTLEPYQTEIEHHFRVEGQQSSAG